MPEADSLAKPDLSLALPRIRQDLEFHPGPPALDGSPSFVIHDPLARTFDKIGWAEAVIFEALRSPKTLGQLMAELDRGTLRLTPGEVVEFCAELERRGLTMSSLHRPVERLLAEREAAKNSFMRWLLHHYLYFRLPLLHPDALLTRWLPYLRFLGSAKALWLYACALLYGLFTLSQRFEEYLSTFSYFFNWQGAFVFGAALTLIKTVHEFVHAFVAKSLGVRVPVMGLAFIVLWPVAFCDVTEGWKLAERRQRLAISGSGILSELVLAGFALCIWGLCGPGPLKSACFAISSTSLGASLLLNLSPAMRFDGYYIFMDLWGIDNLQPRSFALSRWFYRKLFLGIRADCPEAGQPAGRRAGMVVYSLAVFAYRMSVYVAIAVFVYYKFTKVLGIFLFGVEVWWFILNPFIQEGRALYMMRKKLTLNRRLGATLCLVLLAALYLILPLPRSFEVPAVVAPQDAQIVYAPYPGELRGLSVGLSSQVQAGQELGRIYSFENEENIKAWELERDIIEKKYELLSLDDQDKAFLPQQREELANAAAKLAGYYKQREQSRILAETSGLVLEFDENLREGLPLKKGQILCRVADPERFMLYAFVDEREVGAVEPGQGARFFSDAASEPLQARIKSISPVRSETIEHLALTSLAKGVLPVVKDPKGRLIMLESHYQLEVELTGQDKPKLGLGQTGKLWLTSPPRSLLAEALRGAWRVILRESGF